MDAKWKDELIRELTDYSAGIHDFITKYHDSSFLSGYAAAREAEVKDFKLFEEKLAAFSDALKEEIEKAEDPKVKEKLQAKMDSLPDRVGSIGLLRSVIKYAPKGFFDNYVEDYHHLGLGIVNLETIDEFPNLILFLFLGGSFPALYKINKENENAFLLLWCAYGIRCKPKGTFAKYFDDKYFDILKNLIDKRIPFTSVDDAPDFYSRDAAPFAAGKGEKDGPWVTEEEEQKLLFLDEKGVQEIISFLNGGSYSSIIDAVISFRKKIKAPSFPDLKDLKTLFELSPDEIVIYDNRYYTEKQLEQQQEAERQRQIEERRRLEQEQAQWEAEQRRQAEESWRQQAQVAETNRLLAESNRMQAQQAQEEQRRHREQLAAQKRQAEAVIDARLAELKKELFNLHGPNDTPRRLAVQREIDELERKKRYL